MSNKLNFSIIIKHQYKRWLMTNEIIDQSQQKVLTLLFIFCSLLSKCSQEFEERLPLYFQVSKETRNSTEFIISIPPLFNTYYSCQPTTLESKGEILIKKINGSRCNNMFFFWWIGATTFSQKEKGLKMDT